MAARELDERIQDLPWERIESALTEEGAVVAGPLLRAAECRALRALWSDDRVFRSRVAMGPRRYGVGDYAYFAEPLPPLVATLRTLLYGKLAPLANAWARAFGARAAFPASHARYRAECRAAGQTRPTPLLLRYRTGGRNRLHRDRYGPLEFPIQALVVLDRDGVDFEGGEFLLVENRPRQQSLASAFRPKRGDLLLFCGAERPVQGTRGVLRASHRHGMSALRKGERTALGVIFHDAS